MPLHRMRTGEKLRVSGAVNTASGIAKPSGIRSIWTIASAIVSVTLPSGIHALPKNLFANNANVQWEETDPEILKNSEPETSEPTTEDSIGSQI